MAGPSRNLDSPLRLRLRVTLKLTSCVALLAAAVVLAQYAGLGGGDRVATTRVSVADLAPGEARQAGSVQGTVWILQRDPGMLADSGLRDRWLVVRDRGPRNACPLVWERSAQQFRESCSEARYDAAGRPIEGTPGPGLQSVQHRINESAGTVIIGESPTGR